MKYIKRITDMEIANRLKRSGAVLIEGPKSCGKTMSAECFAKSVVKMDTDPNVASAMAYDPNELLDGEMPRLFDEWQTQRKIWNYVRHRVDDDETAKYLLTGSANSIDDTDQHSGAGRIARMRMRTMSLSELGKSTKKVSLGRLLTDKKYTVKSGATMPSLLDVATTIARGGWPKKATAEDDDAIAYVIDYIDLLATVDVGRATGTKRNPELIRRLLRSIARNVATDVTIATIMRDIEYDAGEVPDRDTISDYLGALNRLMILEDLPAWSANIRSSVALRKTPKRHFVDPSLAVAALGINPKALSEDLRLLGFLFESMVVRDLRVYAQANDATVSFYRDASGREVDAIVQNRDGSFSAFECKLGIESADEAAGKLLEFADLLVGKKPISLNVITANGFAHTRSDGVNIVPIWDLTL